MCRPTKRSRPHFFHKTCYMKREKTDRKCPHCDSNEQPLVVQLKLHMTKVPLSLLQVTSKMTFPDHTKTKQSKDIDEEQMGHSIKLNSGKVISSRGLHEGICKDAMEKVLKDLEDKHSVKYEKKFHELINLNPVRKQLRP